MASLTKMRLILIILIALFFTINTNKVQAKISYEPFIGISGTSFIWVSLDYLFEMDNELSNTAMEYGLFTGEAGAALNFETKHWGIRPEIFVGYYKFRFWDLPNTAYTMFHAGGEFYLQERPYRIGLGVGYFASIIYQEILGYQISPGIYYPGNSSWLSFAILNENWEINFRLRWHYFWAYKKIQNYLSDAVFVIRIVRRI